MCDGVPCMKVKKRTLWMSLEKIKEG